MRAIEHIGKFEGEEVQERHFVFDTTLVLFFLAVEFGQVFGDLNLESLLFGVAVAAVAVLPYYLQTEDRPAFRQWLAGRGLITGFAIIVGVLFRQTLGVILPEMLRFLPLTMLIITGLLSAYIQFYSLLKLRTVK